MCSSHVSSSIAMLYHRWMSPSLLGLFRVVFAPVAGSVVLVSVRRIVGSSMLRYFNIAFLFVTITPPMGGGWLTKAVRSCCKFPEVCH